MTAQRWIVISAVMIGCGYAAAEQEERALALIGRIQHAPIRESSGIIESRQFPGVFWTHNDSGYPPQLFAITREGELVAEFRVDATNVDWEDIAIDEQGRLYIGDIGNNRRRRQEVVVYRVEEPELEDRDGRAVAEARFGRPLKVEAQWRLRYPGEPFDAEALFVHEGSGYIIAKRFDGREAGLYRFSLDEHAPEQMMEHVTDLPIRFPVTAADISRDHERLAVLSVGGLYLFEISGDPAAAGEAEPQYMRYFHPLIEAACFVDEGVLVTAESREIFLFRP